MGDGVVGFGVVIGIVGVVGAGVVGGTVSLISLVASSKGKFSTST